MVEIFKTALLTSYARLRRLPKEFQDVIWINSHSGQRQYPI